MKVLEVSVDGQVIGFYASPEQRPCLAMVANIPRRYMRAQIMTDTATESWQWQLPDIQEGECITFRITEAEPSDIRPPQFVRPLTEAIADVEHSDDEESHLGTENCQGKSEHEGA